MKPVKRCCLLLLVILLLSGCQAAAEQETIALRIVDGAGTGTLVLAGQSAGDVFTVNTEDITILLDGKEADASVLADGMPVEVSYRGGRQETWPVQLQQVDAIYGFSRGSKENPGGTYYDLCGLYLQVLNDLWGQDAGLNDAIAYVSVDLSQAPGDLTEGEKAAIAWIFAGQHRAEPLTLTMEELAEQGYLTEIKLDGAAAPKQYQWEDGLLFTITADNWAENEVYSLPMVKFHAAKWRTPLGAYGFSGCTALWPELGTWSGYQAEAVWIS